MKKNLHQFRDPVSGLTHFAGFLLSIAAFILLETYAATHGNALHIVSSTIFGASLISLYGASSMYHLLPLSPRGITILRRIDHAMIFVLIAGTYTPVCLIQLHGVWGWSILSITWSIAIAGIFQAFFWLNAPRWFSTSLYLVMGWLIIFAFFPLIRSIPVNGIIWFVLGGVCYTGGAVIYALKRPDPVPGIFGFHEIWHLFVMGGSFCHFWAILNYIMIIP